QARRHQRAAACGMWPGRAGALPAAIGALCRALPPGSRPAPETFRLAKFNRPEAVRAGEWHLLPSKNHLANQPMSISVQGRILFVKSVLRYHGYGRPEFYQLPSDGSQGSRELLLAFSWLLNRINLLEQLLTANRVKIGDEASVCTCEDNLSNSWKDRTEIALERPLKRDVDVRYLQWLNGRLRFKWRSLHVDRQEQCKLLHKIHSYTSGCHMDQTIGHFSVTETDLIRQPDSYKQLLQLLESETSRLEAFLEWKQLEPVYCLTVFFSLQVKSRERTLPDEREFCAAVRTITEAVKLKLSDLKYHCAHKKNGMHGSYRLVFKDKRSVISKLQMEEATLKRELKRLQEECRHKLDEIAEGLVGVICIPPIKR
uniref:Tubulin epsilon and delta complex 1 n=1 Tax=Chelydra serpentina TaxID=8475 RepID=A0A8C3SBX5_CHESE